MIRAGSVSGGAQAASNTGMKSLLRSYVQRWNQSAKQFLPGWEMLNLKSMTNVWGLHQYFHQKLSKHSNSLLRSDVEIVRSRIAGSLFSPLWRYLTFPSSSHLPSWLTLYEHPLRKKFCTIQFYLLFFWDQTTKFKNGVDF